MKKLSILFISFLTVISAFLTSCDEDHYGPAPVDVTANYSNKISNPNPNLVLTYNGDAMNGKSVDFSTVTGETAIIALYDILPGERLHPFPFPEIQKDTLFPVMVWEMKH